MANLVFNWTLPTKPDGTLIDPDLENIEIRFTAGAIDLADQSALAAAFNRSPQIALVSAPGTSAVTPIPDFNLNTYIVSTTDTSGNRSSQFIGFQFQATRPADLDVFKAYSEGDPKTPFATSAVGEDITNDNSGDYHWASFANTVTDGLVYGSRLVSVPGRSTPVDNANASSSGWSSTTDPDDLVATSDADYVTQVRDIGSNVTGKVIVSVAGSVDTTDTWSSATRFGGKVGSGTSDVQKGRPGVPGANVLIDKAIVLGAGGNPVGIGAYLFNNVITSAETIAFDNFVTKSLTSNATDLSGGVSTLPEAKIFSGNVYAIWNEGQFAGDTANANSFALIANVINSVAIELGNTYVATNRGPPLDNVFSRYHITANAMPNVTQNAATYTIVNLTQYVDITDKTFQGDPSAISQNVDFRFSKSNVFLSKDLFSDVTSHGNVNVEKFVNFNVASGFMQALSTDQEFRYFQVRLRVKNNNPVENDYLLDKLNYTVDLLDKTFRKKQLIQATNVSYDYSSKDFKREPSISVTVSNTDTAVLAIVSSIGTSTSVINCYFAANGVAVTSKNYPGKVSGKIPVVTLDAVGI